MLSSSHLSGKNMLFTLKTLNKLRKYREIKKSENIEQREFASLMYAKAAEATPEF